MLPINMLYLQYYILTRIQQVCTRSSAKQPFPVHYPHVIGQPNSAADELGSAVNIQQNKHYSSSRTQLIWSGCTEVAPTDVEQVLCCKICWWSPLKSKCRCPYHSCDFVNALLMKKERATISVLLNTYMFCRLSQVVLKVPVNIDSEQRLLALNHKPSSVPLLQANHTVRTPWVNAAVIMACNQ